MVCAGGANALAALVRRRPRRAHQHDAATGGRRTAALQRVGADYRLPADARADPSGQPSPHGTVWRDRIRPHGRSLDRVVPPLDVSSLDPQARGVMEYLAGLGLPPIDKLSPA